MARGKSTEGVPLPAEFVESGGILQISGKPYAVGLAWAGVTESSKISAIARAEAPASGADLLCIRKPAKIQYGLGSKSTGHRPGMAPLAALLADIVDGNFVGVFEVEGGYYLAAVRENQILAGIDRLLHDKDEAQEEFHALYTSSNWSQSYAPGDWSLEGTKNDRLDDLLAGSKPKSKLEPVSRSGSILKIVGVGSVAAAAYFGYSHYEAVQQAKIQAQQAEQMRLAQEQAEADARARNAFKPPAMPWEGRQKGVALLDACVNAVLAAPIGAAGWEPHGVSCVAAPAPPGPDTGKPQTWNMAVTLGRSGGTINWIAPAFNKPGFHPTISEGANDEVVVGWPLPPVDAASYDKSSPTVPVAEARRYLSTQFEEIFQPIDLKDLSGAPIDAPGVAPGGTRGAKRTVILERHLAFSFRTSHDPKEFERILAPVPAFVATSVSLDIKSWTWTIEGTIYERLPLPADLVQAPRNADAPRPVR